MSAILLAILLAAPSVQIRNPSECGLLPAAQQLPCARETRAGRPFAPHDAQAPSVEPSFVGRVGVPDSGEPAPVGISIEERKARAEERIASATETISMVVTLQVLLTVTLLVIAFAAN